MLPKIITGELVEILFKGGTIIKLSKDKFGTNQPYNRLLIKMPENILAEDNRVIQFRQYGIYKYEGENESSNYSVFTDYFCNKREAIKYFEADCKEDRLSNLRIDELKKKNQNA